jgi:hypothetical protein
MWLHKYKELEIYRQGRNNQSNISEDANDNKCASTVVLIKKLPTSYLRSLQLFCKVL